MLLGLCVLTLLFRSDQTTGLMERLCLAYPLGAGLLTIQIFLLGLLHIPLSPQYISVPILMEIAALILWNKRKGIMLLPTPSFRGFGPFFSLKEGLLRKFCLLILVIWIGAKLVSVFMETGLRPISAWDSWANWSAGAKAFYYSQSLLLDNPEELYGRAAVSRASVLSSPPHNPLMQVWLASWVGSFDEVLVKFWSPFYLLCMTGYLYRTASRELNRLSALALSVIFLSSPLMSYHAVEVYSDLPLGAYILFALVSFLKAIRGFQPYWILTGLFSAEAIFTKNEAVIFVIPLMASAMIYLRQQRRNQPFLKNLLRLFTPLLFAIPWLMFKSHYSLSLIHDHVKFETFFQPGVFIQTLKNFFSLANFNVVIIVLPVFIVLSRPSREFIHVLLPLSLYALSFVVLYAAIPGYYAVFLQDTVFYRNVLTYYPSIIFLTILSLKPILTRVSPLYVSGKA